jgi:hypothetical protein
MIKMLDSVSGCYHGWCWIEITILNSENAQKSTILINEGIWVKYFNIFWVETTLWDVGIRIACIITLVNQVQIRWNFSKSNSKEFSFGSILDLLRLSLTKVVIHGWNVGSRKWSQLPVLPDRNNFEISRKQLEINNCNEQRNLDQAFQLFSSWKCFSRWK